MLKVYEELGESSRRELLLALRGGPRRVSELVEATGLKQPNVSNHLARLRARGVVTSSKLGREVYYRLATPEIEAIVQQAVNSGETEQEPIDWDALAKGYAKAAIAGDEQVCADAIDAAIRAQAPVLDVYQELLAPAMALVGTWYKVEAIDEAQEHMASAITERMMARAVQMSAPVARSGKTALLGCAPNSWHVIGLRMIADCLRLNGWKTLFLGANVPIKSFASAVHQHEPDLVLLSCSAIEGVEDALKLVEDLNRARPRKHGYVIGVGGHAVMLNAPRFRKAGADFCAPDLRSFASRYLPQIEADGHVADGHLSFEITCES